MENIYLIAFGATAIIAVYALNKWNYFEAWYQEDDRWYSAILDKYANMLKMWHKSHNTVLSAAQDLDKQITDNRYVIAENNIKIAMLEKQVSDCHEIIDDLDAEVAMLHTNITEMFMENQALEAERNGYCKELEKYTNKPKCPICHRFLKKDGVCSNEKCKNQYRDVTKKVKDDDKPLLADAKVGDLCKRRDGKWVHIELIDPSKERSYMAGDSWYFSNGREYSNREYERDIVHVKQKCKNQYRDVTKKVEDDENIDLTYAPFEGLEGVKVDDTILFSDGVVRKVVLIDQTKLLPSAIKVNPFVGNWAYLNIKDGKHWENKTTIRAIRIATPLDLKLYGGGE